MLNLLTKAHDVDLASYFDVLVSMIANSQKNYNFRYYIITSIKYLQNVIQ